MLLSDTKKISKKEKECIFKVVKIRCNRDIIIESSVTLCNLPPSKGIIIS